MSYRGNIDHWEGFAKTDALWSILTDPDKKDGKWDIQDFFKTGETEIDAVFDMLKGENLLPSDNASALDFGCGVGRLSRALSGRFTSIIGVDASPTMIEMANELNNDIGHISFHLNQTNDLRLIQDENISFIYSAIVLQHIPPAASYNFIDEFCRILKRGGTLVFQVPVADLRRLNMFQLIRTKLKLRERLTRIGIGKKYHMDMNVYDDKRIKNIVNQNRCQVVDVKFTNHTDKAFNGAIRFIKLEEATDFVSALYIVKKT